MTPQRGLLQADTSVFADTQKGSLFTQLSPFRVAADTRHVNGDTDLVFCYSEQTVFYIKETLQYTGTRQGAQYTLTSEEIASDATGLMLRARVQHEHSEGSTLVTTSLMDCMVTEVADEGGHDLERQQQAAEAAAAAAASNSCAGNGGNSSSTVSCDLSSLVDDSYGSDSDSDGDSTPTAAAVAQTSLATSRRLLSAVNSAAGALRAAQTTYELAV
jgi:hypothetical protein